ncbi:hypothetical protein CR513_56678, partial [Mucuna pruriens]
MVESPTWFYQRKTFQNVRHFPRSSLNNSLDLPYHAPLVVARSKPIKTSSMSYFLKGLNDSYHVAHTQILLMHSLPSISQAFSLVLQQERQSSRTAIIESTALTTTFPFPALINWLMSLLSLWILLPLRLYL